MKTNPSFQERVRERSANGFTLIELLVAIAVLAIMMLAITQVMNSAATITLGGFRHMNADSQARLALDRISIDVANMVKRTDVDFYFPDIAATGSNDDQMFFFSESSGYYPPSATSTSITGTGVGSQGSNASLIGYRICPTIDSSGTTGSPQLQRLCKGLVWNGVNSNSNPALAAGYYPLLFLPQTIYNTWGPNNGAAAADITETNTTAGRYDKDYEVIADQVFRLQISYLMQKTYSYTNGSSSGTTTVAGFSTVPNLEGITYTKGGNNVGYFNSKQVVAIIVSIAVLDAKSQKALPTSGLAQFAGQLPSVTIKPVSATLTDANNSSATMPSPSADSTNLPQSVWNKALTDAESTSPNAPMGLPKAVAAQVRFYQRYCYLNQLP